MSMADTEITLTEEDLREAIKELGSYIDITEKDLKLIFDLALRIARQRCAHSWLAREIMTREVVTVKADTDIYEAGRLMIKHKVSGLPVIDNEGRIIGMITQADLLSLAGVPKGHVFNEVVMRYVLHRPSPQLRTAKRVGDIMTKDVVTVSPETTVKTVASILNRKGIKRVPVVDNEGRIMGIVSRADIVKIVCEDALK